MQYKSRHMRLVLLVIVAGLGLASVYRISSAARTEVNPNPQQDVLRLETRINQLEQRLYGIDTSLRTLEQQSRLSTSRGARDEELSVLRSEIQALQQRLAEHECSLAKLDERTLTPAMRARRRSDADDPCRLNVDAPLRFSTRR